MVVHVGAREGATLGKHKLISIAFYAYHRTMKFLEAEERGLHTLCYTLISTSASHKSPVHFKLCATPDVRSRGKGTVGEVR